MQSIIRGVVRYRSLEYFLDDNGIELQLERYAIGNEIVRIFIRMHKSIH